MVLEAAGFWIVILAVSHWWQPHWDLRGSEKPRGGLDDRHPEVQAQVVSKAHQGFGPSQTFLIR